MSLFRRRRRGLRRFRPERARTQAAGPRRRPLEQAAEKGILACLTVVGITLAIGLGSPELSGRAWVGLVALNLTLASFFLRYLLEFRRGAVVSLYRAIGLSGCLVLPLILAQGLELVLGLEELAFLPLALVAMVVALAWNRALALDCTIFSGSTLALYALLRPDWQASIEGLFVSLAGALTACLASERLRRRTAVVRVGLLVGLVQVLVASAFALLHQTDPPGLSELLRTALLGVEGLALGLVVTGGLPLIEGLFGVTTDVSLLELGNTHEQPLLRKLLLEAPGTFHHSYIVGLISEAAAEAVGANPLLARVGALYHDIGKLNKPAYFAENSPEARARHKDLTPEMSTLIISSHTRDGVELGAYYGLPKGVLDFMPEHHGTSCIEYFYHAAVKLRGDENVNQESFRYPGPRPQRIETAIVMIADAIEAISRQMPDPTRTRIADMVHEVALKKMMDRQFDECGMTLRDLDRIEGACVRVLAGIYHTRPTFPKGRPHPLDLSQPAEQRRSESEPRRGDEGGSGGDREQGGPPPRVEARGS